VQIPPKPRSAIDLISWNIACSLIWQRPEVAAQPESFEIPTQH
jgi:hypothetical protein